MQLNKSEFSCNMNDKMQNFSFSPLKTLALKNLEKLNISVCVDMLEFTMKNSQDQFKDMTVETILEWIESLCKYTNVSYTLTNGHGEAVFIFADTYYREDHVKNIQAVSSLLTKNDTILPSIIEYKEISQLDQEHFKLVAQEWFLTISEKLPVAEALFSVYWLLKSYTSYYNILRLIKKKYKLAVFYFDATPAESLLVSWFKNTGVTTVTLQHGMIANNIINETEKNSIFNVIVTQFNADYIFAWNKLCVNQFVKFGFEPTKILLTGPLVCLNKSYKKVLSANNKANVFGIILNPIWQNLQNIKMINIANEFCARNNYTYIVRYHPTMKGDEYNEYTNKYSNSPQNEERTTMLQYIESVDFSIAYRSAAICELITYNSQVFCYFEEDNSSIWNLSKIKSFCNCDELSNAYSQWEKDDFEISKEIVNSVTTDTDIAENYKKNLEMLINTAPKHSKLSALFSRFK